MLPRSGGRIRSWQGRIALLAVLIFVSAGCDWTMFGYGVAHTRSSPDTTLSTSSIGALTTKWAATTGGIVVSSPAVVNGVVYVGSFDSKVYAFNASTGATVWATTTGGAVYSSPAVINGVVYVGSEDNKMYALNVSTGATIWTTTTGGPIDSSPAVINGVVYVGSEDNKLYAFNASTGARLWAATTGGPIDSSPAVANGVVYVGSWDDSLHAFKASNGAPLWTAPIGPVNESSPAVANGVVYYGSTDNKLYAFNASSGVLLWAATTANAIYSSPAVANGTVYVGSDDDKLYAFNASTGATLWTATTGGPIESSPAVANGVVYVGSEDNKLYAFNASTGAPLWAATTGSLRANPHSSPAVANGVVYVGSTENKLYAFAGGFFVSKVTPDSGTWSGNQQVTIAGSGFATGDTVTFSTPDGATYSPPTVRVDSANSLTVTTPEVPLTAVGQLPGGGSSSVIVTNPQGVQSETTIGSAFYYYVPSIGVLINHDSDSPAGGSEYGSCTATVAASSSHKVVLSAGHCVYTPAFKDSSGQTHAGHYMDDFAFAPGYVGPLCPSGPAITKAADFLQCGSAPHGVWSTSDVETSTGWQQKDATLDYSFLVMPPNTNGVPIESAVGGGIPLTFNSGNGNPGAGQSWIALGQPGTNGAIECSGGAGSLSGKGAGPDLMVLSCPNGGHPLEGWSGGPWINNSNGQPIGIGADTAAACSTGDPACNNPPGQELIGAYLGDAAQTTFQDAERR